MLRTGLDTLEICAVVLRVSCRTLTDLAKVRVEQPLLPPAISGALRDLYGHMAMAVEAFAELITAQVSVNAEEAEARLIKELGTARSSRERLAELLLEQVRDHPAQWQLHGALLAEADRVLDELGVEKRSERLLEELDRHAREQRERFPRLHRMAQRLRRYEDGPGG